MGVSYYQNCVFSAVKVVSKKTVSFLFGLTLLASLMNGGQGIAAQNDCCNPCVAEAPSYDFFAYADFLYWKASVTGLPYAVTGTVVTPVTGLEFVDNDKIEEIHFGYKPGFRIGAGYQFDCGWDIIADWTHFHTSAKRSLTATAPHLIEMVWDFIPGVTTSLEAHQSLKYDQVNVDIVKNFSLGSSRVIASPFFGAVGACIHQDLDLKSQRNFDPDLGSETTKIKNHFSGGGLRVGLALEYAPCSWLSVYGKGSYSLLYGKFDLSQHDAAQVPVSGEPVNLFHQAKTSERSLASAFDIIAGLRSTWSFDCFELTAHVSYEFVYFPNQVRVRQILSTGADAFLFQGFGDVGFQGLTAGIGLAF